MDTAPDEQGSISPSQQRLGHLHGELCRIETQLDGVTPLQGHDPAASLATVATEITRLRQITTCYLSSNDRDA